jgi:lysophospholipid acyltransferase (LPLAT)-like uncharacterized protein
MIKLAAGVGTGVLRLWAGTLHRRSNSGGQRIFPWDPRLRERFIYALWHETLFGVPAFRCAAPVTALVSRSSDGELIACICAANGVGTIRGSSSRGGLDAIGEVLRVGRHSHLLVAPDGPRGPRRQVKRGLVYLAAWTGLPIAPIGIGFERPWRVGSWDRTALPRPGSIVTCVAGPAIRIPAGLDRAAMEEQRRLVEEALNAAIMTAEAWAAGGGRVPPPGSTRREAA